MKKSIVIGLACLVLLACGDNTRRDDRFEAVSGSRLKLEWYLYEDGTRQPTASAFYDTELHMRCTPQRWVDDSIRCVPAGDDVVFVDGDCTMRVGRARTDEVPTHFIEYEDDSLGDGVRPARVHLAGAETTEFAQFYEQQGDACRGPFVAADEFLYELAGEFAGDDLVQLHDSELGDGRLGLRIRETDDGLRVATGLRDRERDLACTPASRAESVVCEPTESAPAEYFRDPACREPVVIVAAEAPTPAIASVMDPAGCATYHTVGDEVALPGSLHRRDGEACVRIQLFPPPRTFAIGAPIELPILERTLEEIPGRRLQRILLRDDALRFVDDRLFDTATRAACRRYPFDDVTRCLPASVAPASVLFTSGCAVEVHVAAIPERSCERVTFATTTTADGLDIRAIGDPVSGTLYHLGNGTCQPYSPAPGTLLRTLGPPLALETFVGAVSFGER